MRASVRPSWPARTAAACSPAAGFADTLAQASRMGWTPSHPAFDRNPLDLADEAAAASR